jgi:hypothetical protein
MTRQVVVKAEDSEWPWAQTSHSRDQFSFTIHLDEKQGAKGDKELFQPTLHCCMCCNPANHNMYFESGWLIKSSFITKEKH